jgi:GntR family transcriptional repressor for pyruvate dehydrogenase complex
MAESTEGPRAYRRIDRVRAADQILDDLRDRILQGELPHGSRFPPERDLAEQYGVSSGTVREAVRALAATGLVRVRHGSGSVVTVRTETLIAVSLASAIQLEGAPPTDLMDILGTLNAHAAGLVARTASEEEIAELRRAAEGLADTDDPGRASAELLRFLRLLSALSGNAILAAMCAVLAEIQVELAIELSRRGLLEFRDVAGALYLDRIAVVEALEARDPDRAAQATRAYHDHAMELIGAPPAGGIPDPDPGYARLVSSLMSTKLSSLTR